MMDHDAIRQAIAAYALEAIDSSERATVERELLEHLPGCGECVVLMRDMRELAGDLALGPTPTKPPASLERTILAAVHRGERAPERPRRRTVLSRVAVGAAVLALGASAAWNVILISRADDADRRAAALSPIADLASDPRARTASLRRTEGGAEGSLTLLYRAGGDAYLVGRVASPPPGRVLALWFIDGSVPVPVAFFTPARGIVAVRVNADPSSFARAAITFERGTVRAPTSAPIYMGALA